MSGEDPITRRLDANRIEILTAIGGGKNRGVERAIIGARLDERQSAQKDRMDGFEDTVKNLKAWDRATAAIGAVFGPAIAFVISSLKREQYPDENFLPLLVRWLMVPLLVAGLSLPVLTTASVPTPTPTATLTTEEYYRLRNWAWPTPTRTPWPRILPCETGGTEVLRAGGRHWSGW